MQYVAKIMALLVIKRKKFLKQFIFLMPDGKKPRWPKCVIFKSGRTILYKTLKVSNIPGASEITANLHYNCVQLNLEGCVICIIYLR